jgi:hypothetical protein
MKLKTSILLLALTAGLAALAAAGVGGAQQPTQRSAESQLDVDAWFV